MNVIVDSVYTEKDGRISVHATLLSADGQRLDNVAVQVKSIGDLKDALRAKVVAATDKEESRIALKTAAQTALNELTVEIAAAKEAPKDGSDLDR